MEMNFWFHVARVLGYILIMIFGGSSASSMFEGLSNDDYNKFGFNLMLTLLMIFFMIKLVFA